MTYIYPESHSILNVTVPGQHILEYGYVVRSVVQVGTGIYIRSYGEGINVHWAVAKGNPIVADFAWTHTNGRIRQHIQDLLRGR